MSFTVNWIQQPGKGSNDDNQYQNNDNDNRFVEYKVYQFLLVFMMYLLNWRNRVWFFRRQALHASCCCLISGYLCCCASLIIVNSKFNETILYISKKINGSDRTTYVNKLQLFHPKSSWVNMACFSSQWDSIPGHSWSCTIRQSRTRCISFAHLLGVPLFDKARLQKSSNFIS